MKRSSDSSNQDHPSIVPPIVFCPICKTRPMAIKTLQTGLLTKQMKVEYFCSNCGAEIEETI
jgi:DNA-directed RNA polymerase subunit M/transcription elongation factor TFIIS